MSRNQYLHAMNMSKALSRAQWSFIGILFPLIGIIIGLIAISTAKHIEIKDDEERVQVARIKRLARWGVVVSIISLFVTWVLWYVFLGAVDRTVETM